MRKLKNLFFDKANLKRSPKIPPKNQRIPELPRAPKRSPKIPKAPQKMHMDQKMPMDVHGRPETFREAMEMSSKICLKPLAVM